MMYLPSNNIIERVRSLIKRRLGDADLAYLGDSHGEGARVDVPEASGYVYVHFAAGGVDENGYAIYTPPQMAWAGGVAYPNLPGCPVYVKASDSGGLEIKSVHPQGLKQAGIDARVLNPLNQQSKFVYLWQLTMGLASTVATTATDSFLITVKSFRHYVGNTFQTFETPGPADMVDLEPYVPAADMHCYAAIWLDPYTNLPVVTTSTAQALTIPMDLTDIQELAAARPADAIPLKAFYLSNDQSAIRASAQDTELRQVLNTPQLWGFPNVLSHLERVWPNRTLVTGPYTASGIGAIALESGAQIIIVHKNNFTAVVPPANTDDSGDGYSIGSLWFDTVTGLLYVATSVGVGTATWEAVASGGGGAPDDATYILQVADGDLPNAQAMGALASGIVYSTTTTGVQSIAVPNTNYLPPVSPIMSSATINSSITGSAISDDATFAAPSSTTVPTTNAVKGYVDAVAQGLSIKRSVNEATTAPLPANTYNNGASGVGATLIGVATGVLTVDGQTVALNDRVLVKNEVTTANNGIYLCTTAGAIGVAYVLTRATDMNQPDEIPGAFTFVEDGTVNNGAGFVVADEGPFTIGTTAIPWTQFSSAGGTVTSVGLTMPTGVFNVANSPVTGSDTLAVTFDNQTENTIFAGPSSGGTGQPLFRAMVTNDLQDIVSVSNFDPFSSTETTIDPTVSDDSSLGYPVRARWLNTTTDTEFVCTDNTVGAAVWKITTVGAANINVTDHNAVIGGGSAGLTSLAPGTARNVMVSDGTDWDSRALELADLPIEFAILRDEKAANTAGGTSSATTWNARDLNTELYDPDSIVSISSNQFTPIAGDYEIEVFTPFVGGATATLGRARLYNVTGAAAVEEGLSTFALPNATTTSVLNCTFTANGSSAYRIDTYTNVGRATNGLGVAVNDGSAEVYTMINLRKIS